MTAQEVFDFVVNHLRTQGKQAVDRDGDCQYCTPDGLKCAVGCLIPDDKYDPCIEGCALLQAHFRPSNNNYKIMFAPAININATGTSKLMEIIAELEYTPYLKLLSALQRVHDSHLDQCEKYFQLIAKHFDLEYKQPVT